MRKWLIVSILMLAGMLGGTGKASACWGVFGCGYAVCGYPAFCGYAGTGGCYYYPWYYPWFANYNYSSSPYAWPGGYAAGNYPAYLPSRPQTTTMALASTAAAPATVTANLPADAELLFNGQPASGADGASRSFQTTPLAPGQEYEYTLRPASRGTAKRRPRPKSCG